MIIIIPLILSVVLYIGIAPFVYYKIYGPILSLNKGKPFLEKIFKECWVHSTVPTIMCSFSSESYIGRVDSLLCKYHISNQGQILRGSALHKMIENKFSELNNRI